MGPRIRIVARAVAIGALFAASFGSAHALPPPDVVVVPDAGGRPTLPGQVQPPAEARLAPMQPEAKAPATLLPKEELKRQERRSAVAAPKARAAASVAPPSRRRGWDEPVPGIVVLLDGGLAALPDAALSATGLEGFASVRGSTVDLSVLWPTSARHAFGGRLGVLVPSMAAQNWWSASGRPVWIDVRALAVELGFTFAYWRPLTGPFALVGRLGAGVAVFSGEVRRVETLPSCLKGQEAQCPHWRIAGRLSDPMPPAAPSLQATLGLAVEVAAGLHLRVEGGLRDLPWVGVGLGLRR